MNSEEPVSGSYQTECLMEMGPRTQARTTIIQVFFFNFSDLAFSTGTSEGQFYI